MINNANEVHDYANEVDDNNKNTLNSRCLSSLDIYGLTKTTTTIILIIVIIEIINNNNC